MGLADLAQREPPIALGAGIFRVNRQEPRVDFQFLVGVRQHHLVIAGTDGEIGGDLVHGPQARGGIAGTSS